MGQKFIVGYNGATGGDDALALATTLAGAAQEQDAAIVVACISPLPPVGMISRANRASFEEALAHEADRHLRAARNVCGTRGDVTFESRAARSPAQGLHLLADELDADLIIVGRSGTGPAGRAFTGSATEQTLHGAPCPVAVAPTGYTDGHHRIETIAVACNGTDESQNALSHATRLARDRGASIRLVRVVEPVPIGYGGMMDPYPFASRREYDEQALRTTASSVADVPVETTVLDGDPVRALSHLADPVDLLVLGSRDFGPVGRVLLGSVSSRLCRHSPTPLLVVPRSVGADPTAVEQRTAGHPQTV